MARHCLTHAGASPGIAIGRAHVMNPFIADRPSYWITDQQCKAEIERFQRAVEQSIAQLTEARARLSLFHQREQGEIIEAHILILKDELLVTQTMTTMTQQAINAEWALAKTLDSLMGTFGGMHHDYLRQRREDIEQIGQRLMWNLLGTPERTLTKMPYASTILVARDLTPAEVAAVPRRTTKGMLTAQGGQTSHTAIIARSLEIPALLGIGDLFEQITEGGTVILDADAREVILDPSPTEVATYRNRRTRQRESLRDLLKERALPATTVDGHTMALGANIELLDEVPAALEHGAEQIGMFRTEYLFLNRPALPTEEEQFLQYRETLRHMAPRPVTIRTLDIGGDNISGFGDQAAHTNPALGLRAIRFCLHNPDLFATQLRALYRASIHGPLRILLPFISSVEEVRQTFQLIAQVQETLRRQEVPFDPEVPIGIMIEIPAAVMLGDQLASLVDFFSIGTNDLTQYTLAVDRANEHVAFLSRPLHPAVLRMIHRTTLAAQRHRIPVTCCGEMAGDPMAIPLLLGLDIDTLSMNSITIPRVRRLLRALEFRNAKTLAASALQADTADAVEALVRAEVAHLL
ncbi:MAG: phosphoenolpyruvate--protein phosphotransferase [Deltaproteobacteria bacterium]|nr:phosphoenolpyruvate--protein phosphotransferase [Deltaproteobacteria bacterium]